MSYQLKRLSPKGLAAALERAKHYRDLNQPDEAESICRDILDVDPNHQEALKTLGLALTDRFPKMWHSLFEETVRVFDALTDEYERVYYHGVAWERLAKAHLDHHQAHNAAHAFEHALMLFERAGELAPEASDPILRWNRCVRALQQHPDIARAVEAPRTSGYDTGDYE
jgi:tetratricopeptide (TPR) repeat protein